MTSEEKIISAFLELIKNECYSKVSIAEIMRKAKLTRTYFYQSFDSKCDLARKSLFSIIDELLEPLSHALINGEKIDHDQILRAISFVNQHKSTMLTLIFYQGPEFNFQGEIKNWLKDKITQQIKTKPQRDIQNDDFFAEMFATSLVKMIDWFIHQETVGPEQMSDLVERSLSSGLISVLDK